MMPTIQRPRWWWITLSVAALGTLAALAQCFGGGGETDPPPTVSDITVDFPGASTSTKPLLLYSGKEQSSCVEYAARVADPTVILDDVSYDPACPVEIDAFAPGFGAFARNVDPGTSGSETWLTNAITSGTLSVVLPPLTPVPVRLWLVGASSKMGAIKLVRKTQLDKAYPILNVFGTGLTLDTSSVELNSLGTLVPSCSSAVAIAADPTIYQASRINVYFVEGYNNNPSTGSYGYNCFAQGHPEILFVSWGRAFLPPPTLVHELGHAMGLQLPTGTNGHTLGEADFSSWNLMASSSDVKEITIGQLYVINFAKLSWLNRAGSPFMRPVTRTCQDSWYGDECPQLVMVQAGWPPP